MPFPNPSRGTRLFLLRLTLIALAAFVLRLAVSFQLMDSYPPATNPAPGTDNFTYDRQAQEIVKNGYAKFLNDGFYFQPFYATVFLPAIYLIWGTGESRIIGVVLAQSILGALCVWLSGYAAARVFNRRAGLIAALLLGLDRMHIFYTPFTLIEPLQGFWMSLLFFLSVEAVKRQNASL